MPVSRFLHFSSRHRSLTDLLTRLPRSGASKRVQCFSNAKSSGHGTGKPDANPVMSVKSQASGSTASGSTATYVVPAAAVLGFAGLVTFLHYNDERRAVPKGQVDDRSGKAVYGPIVGGPFTLLDTEKRMVTERTFLGNWVLLYFGYTSSPDLGPDQVKTMAKAIDILAVRQMAQEYRVYFKKVEEEGGDYLVDSSHNMYLLNPKMEVVRCFGVEYNADELSKEILNELNRNTT